MSKNLKSAMICLLLYNRKVNEGISFKEHIQTIKKPKPQRLSIARTINIIDKK